MKKKCTIIMAVTLMVAFALAGCGNSTSDSADTIITGTIYTEDNDDSVVSAVAIKDGKIVYAGDESGIEEYQGDDTETIETGDGIALPSFIDAHAHGNEGGVGELYEVDLNGGENYQDYLDAVEAFVNDSSHDDLEVIYGQGWINGYLPDEGAQASDLDEICDDRALILTSGDHHSMWVNTKALEMADINSKTDANGGVIVKDSDGNPTGVLREGAMGLIDSVAPDYTVEQYKEGIMQFQNEAVQYGMTGYYEPMVNLNGSENLLTAYNELDEDGEMIMKVYGGYQVSGGDGMEEDIEAALQAREDTAGGQFEVISVKILADGVIEGHTAALSESYADDADDYGEMNFTQDELDALTLALNEEGMTVHAHCIGDKATTMVLDAYEKANKELDNSAEVRNAITHLQIVSDEDFERMAELNVIAATNAYWFLKEPGYYEELEVPYLGEERASTEYPQKDFFDAGITVTTASDYPVTIPNAPLAAIQTGVTRMSLDGDDSTLQNKEQRVTVEQMIKSCTINVAFQNFDEENTGSIEVGKEADVVLLGKDIKKIDSTDIISTTVLKTINDGVTVYEAE